MTTTRLAGRADRGLQGSRGLLPCSLGRVFHWSGGLRDRLDPLPRGGDRLGPWPGSGDFQVPAPPAAYQAGGGVQAPVASLNLETIMVLGEADGDHPGHPRRTRWPRCQVPTLRMRSASLMKRINSLTGKDYTTITLDRPGPHNRPKADTTIPSRQNRRLRFQVS